jgi:hypothetical protein
VAQLESALKEDVKGELNNRSQLGDFYEQQRNGRARNVVTESDFNFDSGKAKQPARQPADKESFRLNWGNNGSSPADRTDAFEDRVGGLVEGKGAVTDAPQPSESFSRLQIPAAPAQPAPEGGQGQSRGRQVNRAADAQTGNRAMRYQQKLEESSDRTANAEEANAPGAQGAAQGLVVPQARLSGGEGRGGAVTGREGQRRELHEVERQKLNQLGYVNGAPTAGLPPTGAGGAGPGAAPATPPAATGFVSLDVSIPERGRAYDFTTPRGDIQITGRAVSSPLLGTLARLALAAQVLAVAVLVYRRLRRLRVRPVDPRRSSNVLIAIGAASALLGVLPVLGVLVLLAGVAMKVKLRRARALA